MRIKKKSFDKIIIILAKKKKLIIKLKIKSKFSGYEYCIRS